MEELKFEEGTLLVIEVKTTLGKSRTPGFLKTQAGGGEQNMQRIESLIRKQRQGWEEASLKAMDPDFTSKLTAIRKSTLQGKVVHVHAQVFFDPKGHPSTLTEHPNGIQLNHWN